MWVAWCLGLASGQSWSTPVAGLATSVFTQEGLLSELWVESGGTMFTRWGVWCPWTHRPLEAWKAAAASVGRPTPRPQPLAAAPCLRTHLGQVSHLPEAFCCPLRGQADPPQVSLSGSIQPTHRGPTCHPPGFPSLRRGVEAPWGPCPARPQEQVPGACRCCSCREAGVQGQADTGVREIRGSGGRGDENTLLRKALSPG